MTYYTLREEIAMAGLNGEMLIGIDNKYGEVVIGKITVKELLNGRHKTILNKKVNNVFKGTDGITYVFVLNSKR